MSSTRCSGSQAEAYLQDLAKGLDPVEQIMSQAENGSLDQPAQEGWSPAQVLGHLLACQKVWGRTIFMMLMVDDPRVIKVHHNQWGKTWGYFDEGFAALLGLFRASRRRMLKVLSGLDDDVW